MRFLADENFNGHILKGVWSINPNADIIRAQDTEIYQQDDPVVLEYAANHNRILLTHDLKTMRKYAEERTRAGLLMPGVFLVPDKMPIGRAIEDILTVIGASETDDWNGKVEFLPL